MIMKILDWMHRKLHPATNYSRVSHHTKAPAFERDIVDQIDPAHQPPSAAGIEPGTETPLLRHVSLAGILTIGTLGHSHPFFLPYFSEEPKLELPEKEIQAVVKPPAQIAPSQPAIKSLMIKTEQFVVEVDVPEEKIMVEPLLKEEMERKERTTLADLLSAESQALGRKQSPAVALNKSAPASKLKGGAKEKKKVNRKKKGVDLESSQSETLAAAQKIQRMITRMVKKKIHPEAGTKGGGAAAVAADMLPLSGGDAA